jgi:hypothetical protein
LMSVCVIHLWIPHLGTRRKCRVSDSGRLLTFRIQRAPASLLAGREKIDPQYRAISLANERPPGVFIPIKSRGSARLNPADLCVQNGTM